MLLDLDNLPSEPALLQHLVRDMATVVEHRDGEIVRLKSIIKQLQRAQFGRRSGTPFGRYSRCASKSASGLGGMAMAISETPILSTGSTRYSPTGTLADAFQINFGRWSIHAGAATRTAPPNIAR